MAAPAFGSIGALFAATTSTASFAVPADVAADDVIVVAFYTDLSGTTVTAMPPGFAYAENSPQPVAGGGGLTYSLNVCWKRATAADTGTYDFALSAAVAVEGNAVRYTGCVSTGNPWDSPTATSTGDAVNQTTTVDVAVATLGPDRLLFFAGSSWAGDSGTWTGPAGFSERQGGTSATNVEISDTLQPAQGASGNVHATTTSASNSYVGAFLGALVGISPAAPPPRPPRALFDRMARDYETRYRFLVPDSVRTNTSEGGSNGAAITPGNSGGVSGDAWTTIGTSTSCTVTFDNAHAAHGGLSVKSLLGATAGEAYTIWDLPYAYRTVWIRTYVYVTANPSATVVIQKTLGPPGTTNASIVGISTTGHIVLTDNVGTTQATSANTVPFNAWFRLECMHVGDAVNGSVEAKLYLSPDAGTPTETFSTPTIVTTGPINEIRLGPTGVAVANYTMWLDDQAVSTVGYLGPAGNPFTPDRVGAGRRRVFGLRPPRGQVFRIPASSHAASVTASPFVGPMLGARHPVAPVARLPRGRFFVSPPQAAPPVVPPSFVGPMLGARHPVAPTARLPRGRFFPVALRPPAFTGPQIGARHPVVPLARFARGRFLTLRQAPASTVPNRLNGRPARPFIPRRGTFFPAPTPAVVVVTTGPLVPRPLRLAIHWPGVVRRGRIVAAPTAPASTVPRLLRVALRWPGVPRRGQTFAVPVPAPVVVTTGPLVPRPLRLAIHWPGAVKRGRILAPPAPQVAPPPTQTHRVGQWRPVPRRGQIFPVPVPAVVVAQTGPLVPRPLRLAIHWPGVVRRGQTFRVPVPAPVAPTGPVIPKTTRAAIHWPGPVRRGRLFVIPSSSQAAPTLTTFAPRMIQPHQPTRVLARRGRITPTPAGQPGRIPSPIRSSSPVGARGARPGTMPRGRRWITPTAPTAGFPGSIGPARRASAVRPSRGRFFAILPARIIVPNPLYVHRIMRARPRFWYFARRGATQFTRLTGALGFPAELITASSGLGMILADTGMAMTVGATTGSADFTSGDVGVTFIDGDSGAEFRSGP